jgi:hypothetical protein
LRTHAPKLLKLGLLGLLKPLGLGRERARFFIRLPPPLVRLRTVGVRRLEPLQFGR